MRAELDPGGVAVCTCGHGQSCRAPDWGATVYGPPQLATRAQTAELLDWALVDVYDRYGSPFTFARLVDAVNWSSAGSHVVDEDVLREIAAALPCLRERADGTWEVAWEPW